MPQPERPIVDGRGQRAVGREGDRRGPEHRAAVAVGREGVDEARPGARVGVEVVGSDAQHQRETRLGVARLGGAQHEIGGDGGAVPVVVLVVDHPEQRGQRGESDDGQRRGEPGEPALATVVACQLFLLNPTDSRTDVHDAMAQGQRRVGISGPEAAREPADGERAQPPERHGQQFRVWRGVRVRAAQCRPRLLLLESVTQCGWQLVRLTRGPDDDDPLDGTVFGVVVAPPPHLALHPLRVGGLRRGEQHQPVRLLQADLQRRPEPVADG